MTAVGGDIFVFGGYTDSGEGVLNFG